MQTMDQVTGTETGTIAAPPRVVDPATRIDRIARVCHQANKAYCESLGDQSQREWEHAPEWQRESARAGVLFHLTNPNSKPEDSHNSWLKQKTADGWVYGPVKDVTAKTHPCFRPYKELPPEQQAKDALFIAVVRACCPESAEVSEPVSGETAPVMVSATDDATPTIVLGPGFGPQVQGSWRLKSISYDERVLAMMRVSPAEQEPPPPLPEKAND